MHKGTNFADTELHHLHHAHISYAHNMTKRLLDADEDAAEAEIAAAIAAAAAAPADEEISGLGTGRAVVHFEVPAVAAPQYTKLGPGRKAGEKKLVFLYLCIRGLGETPRLMLAEAGAEYTFLASPMGEAQDVACEWRKRSPNGLTPVLSGLGVPRATPLSQSAVVVRFLASRYGLAGETELDGLRAGVLFETAKDLKGKKDEIVEMQEGTTGPKGPAATAASIAAMLEEMPDIADEGAALNYGQIELLNLLMDCEEQAPGCVTALSPTLDRYRAAGAARPRIKQYLASPLRFPRNIAGYKYASGPIKRSALVL